MPWRAQLKYGAQGYLDPNAGKSDLLAYLYGPSNTPSAPNVRARSRAGISAVPMLFSAVLSGLETLTEVAVCWGRSRSPAP